MAVGSKKGKKIDTKILNTIAKGYSPVQEEQHELPLNKPVQNIPYEKSNQQANTQQTNVTVNVNLPDTVTFLEKLNTLLTQTDITNNIIETLNKRIYEMALNLDTLTAEVARAKTVQASAIELIKKIAGELETVSANLAAAQHEPPVDTSGLDALAADLRASTDALASAVASSVDVKPTQTVILNADDPTVPTTEVVLPAEVPAVVTTTVEQVVETVDPTSPEPQVQIVVEPAPAPVVDAVEAAPAEVVADPAQNVTTAEGQELETGVVKTEEGSTDVTVATPVEDAAVATDAGINVVDTVAQAVEEAPEVTVAPETPATE